MQIERKPLASKILVTALVVAFTAVCVFPFYWTLLTSVKSRVDVIDPSVWFFKPTIENYVNVFTKRNLLFNIVNSLIVVSSTTVVSLALGTLAAYGFARFSFKRKEDVAFWVLSLRMLPPMAVVISFFVLGRLLHMLDNHLYLAIIYLSFNIPFTIWMMRGFIEDVPIEIEESAWIDGCSRYSGFFRIVFPIVSPGLVATAIFCVIQSWNEFSLAFFLTSFNAKTIPTIVTAFLSVTGVLWGEMAAVGIIAITPIVVFSFFVQKNLVRGMTFGAIKG